MGANTISPELSRAAPRTEPPAKRPVAVRPAACLIAQRFTLTSPRSTSPRRRRPRGHDRGRRPGRERAPCPGPQRWRRWRGSWWT